MNEARIESTNLESISSSVATGVEGGAVIGVGDKPRAGTEYKTIAGDGVDGAHGIATTAETGAESDAEAGVQKGTDARAKNEVGVKEVGGGTAKEDAPKADGKYD
ncbi:hypothetical protein U1Q18_030615 [Sarracenia purpurea var. burkii]